VPGVNFGGQAEQTGCEGQENPRDGEITRAPSEEGEGPGR